jgi:sulfane dehydrogenase subunit SoxC
MRLVLPGWEGILNVKWLRQLRLTDKPLMSRDETAQYTELQPNGKARQFTFVMEAKSLITSPSLGMKLPDNPGVYQISGLAWSGRGKISRVEISVDGGKSWTDATLSSPVLPKSFTRFNLSWKWQGNYAILQSRATDETGYIQPTRESLVTNKGRHGFFHYNAIVSWEVTETGDINHVYDL